LEFSTLDLVPSAPKFRQEPWRACRTTRESKGLAKCVSHDYDEVAKHGTLAVITGCAMAKQPESMWALGKEM
jgi:hypothetical protein